MREAQADPRATPAEAALAACLATVLELPVEEVPEPEPGVDLPDGWRRWLAGRGVGLVPTDILTEGTIAVGDRVDAIEDPAS